MAAASAYWPPCGEYAIDLRFSGSHAALPASSSRHGVLAKRLTFTLTAREAVRGQRTGASVRGGFFVEVREDLMDDDGSSMPARACPASEASALGMILTGPWQLGQISMSMWKPRFRRRAQVMAAREAAGVFASPCSREEAGRRGRVGSV